MRYAFIEAEKAKYPVRVLSRCLQVSASGYYGLRGSEASARSREDARLVQGRDLLGDIGFTYLPAEPAVAGSH